MSRSPLIDLPRTSRKIGTHPTIKGSNTLKLDEHEDLRGSSRQSVIPYIVVWVVLFKAKLNLVSPVIYLTFYSSRPGSYTVTQGPIGGPRVVGSLYSSALPGRNSK
jgi:hypothetical protein